MIRIINSIKYVAEKGFFHLLSVNFLTQFLGFGTSLLVAKFLTPVELGDVKIIQSYANIFLLIGGIGINSALLKFGAEDRDLDEKQAILLASVKLSLGSSLVAWIILCILSLGKIITSTGHLSTWLIIYSLIIPLGVITNLFIVYLQAQKKTKEMAQAQAWIKLQSFGLIVLATYLFGFKGFIFSTIAAYGMGLIPLFRQIGFDFIKAAKFILPAQFLSIAVLSVAGNVLNLIGTNVDIYVLDHFATDRAEIGVYSLATIFVHAAYQISNTVQVISTPYFVQNAANKSWLQKKLIHTQLRASLFSIVSAVGIIIVSFGLITFIYGETYRSTMTYLVILLLRYIIYSSSVVASVVIFSMGLVKYNVINTLISVITGIIMSYLLFQKYSFIGVAWAQVISVLVLFTLTHFVTWKLILRKDEIAPVADKLPNT